MSPAYYYDDPEEGLSRQTSHPNFLSLAPEDFYYEVCDDFSPFGSDDGFDTLQALQDWYQNTDDTRSSATQFLQQLLQNWDMGPEDLIKQGPGFWEKWLVEEEIHAAFLAAHCRASVACAFGQLKITGNSEPHIIHTALAALEAWQWLNRRARVRYPEWEYADLEQSRLLTMQKALQSLT